ncbi:MAG: hypothetical protein ABTQ26_06950 [Azonexus sp.]
MKAAIVKNGVVENVIEVVTLDFIPGLVNGDGASIGDTWDGTKFFKPAPPMPSLKDYDDALTAHIDAVAQSRNWADRVSLMARAGFAGPWKADAIAFGLWADNCNLIGYTMLTDFQAGKIPQPNVSDVLGALPEMVWP